MNKDTRYLIDKLRKRGCAGCIYYKAEACKHLENGSHCTGNVDHDAADLIESLSNDLDAFADVAESPGWIEDLGRENVRLAQALEQVKRERDAPAVDAEPVRHGRWISCETADGWFRNIVKCSECSKKEDRKSDYCPNCGAKMDLEEQK